MNMNIKLRMPQGMLQNFQAFLKFSNVSFNIWTLLRVLWNYKYGKRDLNLFFFKLNNTETKISMSLGVSKMYKHFFLTWTNTGEQYYSDRMFLKCTNDEGSSFSGVTKMYKCFGKDVAISKRLQKWQTFG